MNEHAKAVLLWKRVTRIAENIRSAVYHGDQPTRTDLPEIVKLKTVSARTVYNAFERALERSSQDLDRATKEYEAVKALHFQVAIPIKAAMEAGKESIDRPFIGGPFA